MRYGRLDVVGCEGETDNVYWLAAYHHNFCTLRMAMNWTAPGVN